MSCDQDLLAIYSEKVEQHGWAICYVMGEDGKPPFAYTIGLCAKGLPEILLMGLGQKATGSLLHRVVERLFRRPPLMEEWLNTKEGVEGILADDYRVKFVKLYEDQDDYAFISRTWAEENDHLDEYHLPVVQMIWENADRTFKPNLNQLYLE